MRRPVADDAVAYEIDMDAFIGRPVALEDTDAAGESGHRPNSSWPKQFGFSQRAFMGDDQRFSADIMRQIRVDPHARPSLLVRVSPARLRRGGRASGAGVTGCPCASSQSPFRDGQFREGVPAAMDFLLPGM
jgi:hypothetical protein